MSRKTKSRPKHAAPRKGAASVDTQNDVRSKKEAAETIMPDDEGDKVAPADGDSEPESSPADGEPELTPAPVEEKFEPSSEGGKPSAPAPAPAPAPKPQAPVSQVAASLNHPLTRPPIADAVQVKEPAPIRGEWQSVTGRDVAALLDPRPTLVVGAIGRRDEVGFATIIWATPISHEPSMVAFSLRARSHTMGCLQKSGCFSLNVLPATPQGIECCEQCGTRTGYQFNKIVVVKHHLLELEYDKTETVEVEVPQKGIFRRTAIEEAERTSHIRGRVPIVDCATSWLACDVDHIEEAGDHLLVIGNVIEAQTCAVRNENGLLIPQDVLQCVQHGCYAKVELLD